MSDKFELNGLTNIFKESLERNEPTLIFEINNGRGRFLFMMFFDAEDQSTKDQLFIFLRNTQKMLQVKIYGNHHKGIFTIYLDQQKRNLFIQELDLGKVSNSNSFDFSRFLATVNNSIPKTLPLHNKIQKLKESWSDIQQYVPSDIVDESNKTILIGPRQLAPNKKPREKTLRKLYLFADGSFNETSQLINNLKKMNMTVAWTDDESKVNINVKSLLTMLK